MSADLEARLAKVTAERDDLRGRWRDLNTAMVAGRAVLDVSKEALRSTRGFREWVGLFDVFVILLDGVQKHVDAALKEGGS